MSGVAVNLLWCVPGDVGGSEQYLTRQLDGITGSDAPQPTLFVNRRFRAAYPALCDRFEVVVAPGENISRAQRIAIEATWLYERTRQFALVHHGGGTAPLLRRKPYVLTMHDLQFLTYPQYFRPSKLAYLQRAVRWSVGAAERIAVPSPYVAASVAAAYSIDPARIDVVPHGIDTDLARRATPAGELRARFALGDHRFVVFPAASFPHKNHLFLFELMRLAWSDPNLRLVLIGGQGLGEAAVSAAAASNPRVVRLGRVSDADRNGLLAAAEAMVFPSQYEGFGAPLIEAMAVGCPVVCSDATCLPWVAGDAALVLPLSIDAWAGALDEVARRRTELIGKGAARAGEFSSVKSAAALLATYRRAMGGR